ncbi:hypothetical protein [Desulfovibrio litoralis]|uniref:SGNH hydrolase-like domain-containing protein, acetyltransferase AlgX n=1 Tax=Desulfovibrio litoralis DSM 11393 TaxID=1121455 RepID=A0A1M7RYX9_9BACT|nr:hypothetical protein [Desulfovibrio litoralis]SHN51360.1 hypothetical protein SAMN02745728_00342 [Desulfovibrio litoralis DSM 11393]
MGFKYCYDIDWGEDSCNISKTMFDNHKRQYAKRQIRPSDTFGYLSPEIFFGQELSVGDRVKQHLLAYNRPKNELEYLYKIIELSQQIKHELIIVIPPAREDYKKFIPDNIFCDLFLAVKNKNIKIVDLFSPNNLESEDFGDTDHLTPKGAIKASKWLNSLI